MKRKIRNGFLYLGIMGLAISGCQSADQKQHTADETASQQEVDRQEKHKKKQDKKEIWIENPLSEKDRAYVEGQSQMNNGESEMYLNAIVPCEPLNLTREQKLEDFDFFWNTIRDKVYCLEEDFAAAGIDYEAYIAGFREQAAQNENDYEFWRILEDSKQMCRGWHINLVSPYSALIESLNDVGEINMIRKTTGDEQKRKLKYWDVLLSQNDYQYKSSRQKMLMAEPMPELKIIDDQTAVITVPTFGYATQMEKAGNLYIEYMKQVSDYENVIFDLKGNRGGISRFLYHNLIAPNIDEPLNSTNLRFFKMGKDIADTELIPATEGGPWTYQFGYRKDTIYASAPLSELPKELEIENSDYGNADYFVRTDFSVLPRYDHKILKGNLWVLTYPENYSAAEEFVSLCKDTGFATLVGKQTKGDGGGGMALRFVLPNSGLIGSVQSLWTLNEDGTNNSIEGTKPDLESPEGETPLETCLKAIEES